jgi:HEAT repeat protein
VASEDAAGALQRAARDEDATVRAGAVRAAARAGHPPDPATVSLALSDPDATVRMAAIHAVGSADDSTELIRGALRDGDVAVRAAAAAALLRTDPDEEATSILRGMLGASDPDERALAIEGLGGSASEERVDLFAAALSDPAPRVRAAAARALGRADPDGVMAVLLGALDDPDPFVRVAVAHGLGAVGESAVDPVVSALSDPDRAEGALAALEVLPVIGAREQILDHARGQAASATADFDVARAIRVGDGDGDVQARLLLLRDSLIDRARRRARTALRAMALAGDRESSAFVIDNLSSRDPAQVANALEALEAAGDATVVRPLLRLWEPAVPLDTRREVWLGPLLGDPDPWIRGCAELLDDAMEGATMTEVPAALSDMERVLFLRKVSLFGDLPPRDLSRVAAIAEERTYTDGETIAEQGEQGDELHIVVAGTVRVLRSEPPGQAAELARRTQGEVVGEMALITQEPRMATLLASGDVRTLCVGRVEFEGVLRERPDTAIAVIRVLSQRLVESANSG